eukprot:9401845-Karenia_brevis.AAC.1
MFQPANLYIFREKFVLTRYVKALSFLIDDECAAKRNMKAKASMIRIPKKMQRKKQRKMQSKKRK